MFARGVAKGTLRPFRARSPAQVGHQHRRQRRKQGMLLYRCHQEAAHEAIPNLTTRAKINLRQFVFPRSANQRPALHGREPYITSKKVGIVVGQQNELAWTCAAGPLLSETQLDATLQNIAEPDQLSSGFDAKTAIHP